ncbi:MAG: ankyrin repeat domain-containing protein, partial [Myxococcota bacterium]
MKFPHASSSRTLGPSCEFSSPVEEFVKAVRRGYHRKAEKLLNSLNARQQQEAFGPMLRAGRMEQVKELFRRGAQVNVPPEVEWPPLFWAIVGRQSQMVAWLISEGVDVHVLNPNGHSALHIAVGLWIEEANHRHSHQRKIGGLRDEELAQKRHEIVQILISAGVELNVQDDDGKTPLMIAVA